MPEGGEEEARRFYGDLLGLPESSKPPELASRGGCWFQGEGVEVHLGVERPFNPARKGHPAFLVDDLDDVRARLEKAGVTTSEDASLPGYRRFHAADPFGNRLEFVAPA